MVENLEIPQYKSDVWERCILNFDSAHGTTPCPSSLLGYSSNNMGFFSIPIKKIFELLV
jgi:hypothetical protein